MSQKGLLQEAKVRQPIRPPSVSPRLTVYLFVCCAEHLVRTLRTAIYQAALNPVTRLATYMRTIGVTKTYGVGPNQGTTSSVYASLSSFFRPSDYHSDIMFTTSDLANTGFCDEIAETPTRY